MAHDKASFVGKTFIVTGGGSGLGLACSKRIVRAGGKAIIADLNVEMASATIYLASDDASFITGQTLYVDGGRTVLAFVMPDKQ